MTIIINFKTKIVRISESSQTIEGKWEMNSTIVNYASRNSVWGFIQRAFDDFGPYGFTTVTLER
jgi:hypothetical protein